MTISNQESFVYCWTDHFKEMLYIGVHKGSTEDGYICTSKPMLQEYNKRPKDFSREIIASGIDSDMRKLESKLLKQVDAANNPEYYNQMNAYPNFNMSGREFTEEHKRKIANSNTGKKRTREFKNKLKQANLGKKLSEETKRKIGLASKSISEETRKKISKAAKNRKISKETRKKISETKKGKPQSEKHKRNLSNSLKGRKHSDETKRKMSVSHSNISEETRNKLSIATTNYWKKKKNGCV